MKKGAGLILICACFAWTNAIAQDKKLLDENFPFQEGVFLTFNDFMNNNTIPPSKITGMFSSKVAKASSNSRKDQAKGMSWEFYAELTYSYRASITVDSVTLFLDDSGFEALIPGHNFFGLMINGRLYLNISPHKRPGNFSDPLFGRAAFIGRLIVLYVDFEFDADSYYYVNDSDGNVVREGGMQETTRNTVIFDLVENRFEFADERSFESRLAGDEELLYKYLQDKKRKKSIPYYADQFNKRNPIYFPLR